MFSFGAGWDSMDDQQLLDRRSCDKNMTCSITQSIRNEASDLGFDLVGVAPAVTPQGVTHLREWLERGFAGEMRYMQRHAAAREHPRNVLSDVRSVIVVAMNY